MKNTADLASFEQWLKQTRKKTIPNTLKFWEKRLTGTF